MIEIINENRISAEKIFRDLNEEEKGYLMELIANERPVTALTAASRAVREELARKNS